MKIVIMVSTIAISVGWLLEFNDVTHNEDDLDVGVDRIPTGRCNVGTSQSPEDLRSDHPSHLCPVADLTVGQVGQLTHLACFQTSKWPLFGL